MKVAVDFRITYINQKALRVYTYAFWQDMAISQPDHDFIFVTDKKTAAEQPAKNIQIRALKKINVQWIDQKRLKNLLTACTADRLVTIHETGFIIRHLSNKTGIKKSTQPDKQVWLTGSMQSAGPAVLPGNSAAIYPALHQVITSLTWAESESIKTQYTGGRSFFLFTGDISEAHELIELLKAFSLFKKWQQSNMQLVIAGSNTGFTEELEEKLLTYKYKPDIVILKNISDEITAKLVAACYALVYPVARDAFPLALLWAVQSNKAIIATDNPVNRQLTSAAYWVEAGDTAGGFAKAMKLLYKDEQQQQLLVQQTKALSDQHNRRQMLSSAWQCIE